MLKLKGRGMPDINGRGRGDILYQVVVLTPRKLTARQQELLRELAELDHEPVGHTRKGFFEKLRDYFTEETDADENGPPSTPCTPRVRLDEVRDVPGETRHFTHPLRNAPRSSTATVANRDEDRES